MKRSEHLQAVYDGMLASGRMHSELVGLKRQIAEARDVETAATAAASRDGAIRTFEALAARGADPDRLEPTVQAAERHALVARTTGPNRSGALVTDRRGRLREVRVERRRCARAHDLGCSGQVEFVGDAERSSPCTQCGGTQWRS